jgi:hypothetical protein
MFNWYKASSTCYAFLSDVFPNEREKDATGRNVSQQWEDSLRTSKWFQRGWTLQELIAPTVVRFYDAEWIYIGSKDNLSDAISEISGINTSVLLDGYNRNRYTVATRMSWMARRKTTRAEDEAYCLLGLFNINMPLLYGEGTRAFIRLQEEIFKQEDDLSLLAWTDDEASQGLKPTLRGPLAKSSACFDPCRDESCLIGDFSQVGTLSKATATSANRRRLFNQIHNLDQPLQVTSRGLFVELLVTEDSSGKTEPLLKSGVTVIAFLNCIIRSTGQLVCLALHGEEGGTGEYTRVSVRSPGVRVLPPSTTFSRRKFCLGKPLVEPPIRATRYMARRSFPFKKAAMLLLLNGHPTRGTSESDLLQVQMEYVNSPCHPFLLELRYGNVEFFIACSIEEDTRSRCLIHSAKLLEITHKGMVPKNNHMVTREPDSSIRSLQQIKIKKKISNQRQELESGVYCDVRLSCRPVKWFEDRNISTRIELSYPQPPRYFTLEISVSDRSKKLELVRYLPIPKESGRLRIVDPSSSSTFSHTLKGFAILDLSLCTKANFKD